jgi:hypothetical protein
MTTPTQLGIWMDHSVAYLMEYSHDAMESKTLKSSFTHQEKVNSLSKSENLMHNKEQHQQADYYKNLGKVILRYEEVLLFGPTDAKVELFNMLTADHRFENIKIVTIQADKMTENQQHAFVKDYFLKH